jgi:hypothetical protein
MRLSNVMTLRDSKGDIWPAAKVNRPSEGTLADRFASEHSHEVRFLAAAERDRINRQPARRAGWIALDGEEWLLNDAAAQRLAREICKEAAEACNDPGIDSARVVSAVLSLAKCDLRIFCSDWPPHPELEAAVSEWLSDRCVIDAGSWTPRPAIVASAAAYGWDRFDADELSSELEAHGITYRRIRNVHGFDGVRLKDVDGE